MFLFGIVLSWADVPNWPIMPTNQELDEENDPTSRSDSVSDNLIDPGNNRFLISRHFVTQNLN